ncbi:putative phage tail protein [Sporosarcina sp. P17b]|uniref:putative phage tail protein n=1 Tax=Sporosarcina sp. P17b TaxID=2048260 RepID=UPI000C16D6F6|nr:putative phage tail protein [Sporosarcina sp. P17b]PIC72440.1 hypothetical protein CSV76_15460 [Sporosarcina sp. P17b]
MTVLPGYRWQDVSVLTWDDLSAYQWMDFRLALMDTETEQSSTGVAVERSYTTATTYTDMTATGVKIVQSPVIVRTRTEMIVNIVVSNRDYKTIMLNNYLPKYERGSRAFNEIIGAYDKEFRRLEQDTEIVNRNMFLDTAIERLNIYERDLGIEPINDLDYRQRREQISSRNRASFAQTTEEIIKIVASGYSNGEVEVNPTETVGLYEVRFVGTRGAPDNLPGLKKALDIIIPAHLGLTYIFTYNTWDSISHLTWNDVAKYTWDELRITEEVI